MRAERPLLLLLAALTAGCADPEPFVDFGGGATVEKPKDPVLVSGTVAICFSDKTPWTEVETLAGERCAAHGLQPAITSIQRQQCRATSPHRAIFRCHDPEMTMPTGQWVNPFDPIAVAKWERATGKKAKPHNFMTGQAPAAAQPGASDTTAPTTTPSTPTAPAPAAPAPAQVAPLAPADIAGRPPIPTMPPRPPAPTVTAPTGGAYPMGDGFTLPQGSWGDHFQD